jgi:DNA-binding IclR family transcriptional regulator
VTPAIPEDVRLFLQQYIDSIEQLEILLLVRASPAEEWTPEAVARALYSNAASTARRLQTLHTQGLVTAGDPPTPRYRYQPAKPELHATIARLADAYRERRVAVTTLVASKPMENVRAFSDAFRLRKKDKD